MKAEFTPSLMTGNEMIDNHHKELIKRANDLFEALESGKDKDKVVETLGFLAEYTTYHFSAEEEIMDDILYPERGEHKAQHEALIQVVKELQAKLEAEGPTDEFANAVNDKVVEWLYGHIKGSDNKVANYKNVRSQFDNMG